MSDLIEREDAIDAIYHHLPSVSMDWARMIMNEVPSVQPNLQPTCNQLATDCISRSAALDVIRNIRAIAGSYDSEMLLIDKAEAQTELMMMPSAQPERKPGRWIIEPGIGCKCSQCEFDIGNDLDWMEYVKFCPNCGAKMEKQNEENAE